MYLNLLCAVCLVYIMFLFTLRCVVTTSLYWAVTFFIIYVFTPLLKDKSYIICNIPESIIESISQYALAGIVVFAISNSITFLFLSKVNRAGPDNMHDELMAGENIIEFETVLRGFKIISLLWLAVMLVTNGVEGIVNIIQVGTSKFIIDKNINILTPIFNIIEILPYLMILPLFITAKTKRQKIISAILIIIIVFMGLIFLYGRRYIIYPFMGIGVYYISGIKSRLKIISVGAVLVAAIIFMMYLMGFSRTWGIKEIGGIKNHLLSSDNAIDLVLQNTDFSASYYFLSKQLMHENVSASPLGYAKLLFVPVPRQIWPDKPQFTSITILSQIEPRASDGFTAGTGYIGEALATFGISGIIVISFLWGIACAIMDNKYIKRLQYSPHRGFTYFQLIYLFFFSDFISEAHRGDFGSASEIYVLVMLMLRLSFKLKKTGKPEIVKTE